MRPLNLAPRSCTFLFSVLLASALTPNARAESSKNTVGKVIEVTGQAWISAPGPKRIRDQKIPSLKKSSQVSLKAGSLLNEGDVITTDADSQAKILLDQQDAALLIKPKSKLTIIHSEKKNWLIDLQEGGVLSHTKKKPNQPHFFRVKTRTAVLGVRGTTFFVKAETGKDLFLCTCEGSVAIDDQVVIQSQHHDAPKWIRSGSEPLESRLKETVVGGDHLDSEAVSLSELIQTK